MKPPTRRDRVPFSYRALQGWARLAVAVFYRRLEVSADSRLPQDRPVILAANHGNALADVAVIIAGTPDFPHFLAAASWWKSAPARLLFGLGGVVPIHRRRDGEHTQQNASSFEECHNALASGASIAIFPEGEMHLEPALLPLKTGAARIALSAAAEAGIAGVVLVPVGLVYDDRGRFRSDAEIHFGEPVEIDDWVDSYRADSVKAVRGVTDLLADRLVEVTVNHGSSEEAAVLDQVASLALAELPRRDNFARRNRLRRALGSAVTRAGGEASAEYEGIVSALHAHQLDLERLGIDRRDTSPLGSPPVRDQARRLAELIALTPPAVVGVVANAPTLLVLRVASRRVPHEAWQATVKGVGGTVLVPVVWAVEFGLASRSVGNRRALMLTASGAIGGAVALVWWERLQRRRQRARVEALERAEPTALLQAQRSRAELRQCIESLVDLPPLVEAD